MRRALPARGLAAVAAAFKLLQFMDRGVQNGSPIEFDIFIQRTTGDKAHTSSLFAALTSIYTVGTVLGCIGASVLLGRGASPHTLMRNGMVAWVVGVFLSAAGFWMPDGVATFVFFCAARAVVGLGGGIVSLTWPPYVEATARASERSLSMTIVETGTALGAALGFVFSATMSASAGWGVAYAALALLMVALALPMACAERAVATPTRLSSLGSSSGAGDAGDAVSASDSEGGRVASDGALTLGSGVGGMGAHLLSSDGATREAPRSWASPVARIRWITSTPGLALFLVGAAFASAALQGLQVFFPAIAVDIGLWEDEVAAATNFGGGIVAGAIFGGVAHGLVAERLSKRLDAPVHERRPAEARLLTLIIACTMMSGGVLATGLSRAMVARQQLAAMAGIVMCGCLLLGSLGLQVRAPLLLLPPELGPTAVLLGTLAGYAGEFSGPPALGMLKDVLAPLCKTIDVNGEEIVDPRCAASASNQRGLGIVLLLPAGLAVTAATFWLLSTCRRPQRAGPVDSGRLTELTRDETDQDYRATPTSNDAAGGWVSSPLRQ